MKKGIIFDLDGTLWDSSRQVVQAWNQVLETHKEINRRITVEDMHHFMGNTNPAIGRLMLPDLPPEASYEIVKECCKQELIELKKHKGRLFDGVENVLKSLKENYSLYIVSNCDDGYIQVFLDSFGFHDYFEDYEMSGRTGNPKGDNIQLVIERNHIKKAAYIGDTQGDFDAACKAGIVFIHAAYGFGEVNQDVPKLYNFTDINTLLKSLL